MCVGLHLFVARIKRTVAWRDMNKKGENQAAGTRGSSNVVKTMLGILVIVLLDVLALQSLAEDASTPVEVRALSYSWPPGIFAMQLDPGREKSPLSRWHVKRR